MLNLHPFRSTDPMGMKRHDTRLTVMLGNLQTIKRACRSSDLVVCAWGTHGRFNGLQDAVIVMLEQMPDRVVCLGFNSDGTPKHPLYLRSDAERVPMFRNT
jgi:hypothetical protein